MATMGPDGMAEAARQSMASGFSLTSWQIRRATQAPPSSWVSKMKNFTPHLMSSMGYFTFALNGSAILRPSLALA